MANTYKHVVLVGIDGAGNYIRSAKTPTIDGLFERGAGTFFAETAFPTNSAECWGSMLIGVDTDIHGLDNDYVESGKVFDDSVHPTIFRLIRNAHPDAVIGAYSNWDPINTGIVGNCPRVDLSTCDDDELTDRVCDYVKSSKPEFLFVQLDNVDHMGHTYGYGSDDYYRMIEHEDANVAKIIAAIDEAGIAEDTLVLVTADHGGIGHDHGGPTDEEKYVFFVAAGKTVPHGAKIEMRVADIPSIVAYALGVEFPDNWQAKLPNGIFTE